MLTLDTDIVAFLSGRGVRLRQNAVHTIDRHGRSRPLADVNLALEAMLGSYDIIGGNPTEDALVASLEDYLGASASEPRGYTRRFGDVADLWLPTNWPNGQLRCFTLRYLDADDE